jgi:hypothetical protein
VRKVKMIPRGEKEGREEKREMGEKGRGEERKGGERREGGRQEGREFSLMLFKEPIQAETRKETSFAHHTETQ